MKNTCASCRHETQTYIHCTESLKCNPEYHTKWEPAGMTKVETKESDYSFNQSIIDAFAQNTIVWRRPKLCKEWIKIGALEAQEMSFGQMFHYNDWSLEKPKTKVKKYQWLYKKQGITFDITDIKYSIKEAENENLKDGCYRLTEPYLPSEIEVEE